MCALRDVSRLTAVVVATAAGTAHAQQAAPVTVTPPTLAPERPDGGFRIDIPEAGALRAPVGSEGLAISLGEVTVEGGFTEVRGQTEAIVAQLKGRRVTLQDIYAAASAIEAAHARAGYVLARVSVPPQTLRDGGPLRIVVTDGFIESVDTSGLPPAVRRAVERRAGALGGRRHLTLREIEAPLLAASDVPGLTLRSTLMRGEQAGGTRLILEGPHRLLTGAVNADNQLDPSLGTYGVSLQLALNSPFRLGEQFYGFAYTGYDPGKWFATTSPVRVLGGGALLPLGDGRLTLNPETTFSRTRPPAVVGAPQTIGYLRRLSLRGTYVLRRTRAARGDLSFAIEQIEERSALPAFATFVSRDRYLALRIGGTWTWSTANGASFGGGVQASQGLGDLTAIGAAAARVAGVPFSRQGARNDFTRLSAQAQASIPLGKAITASLRAKGQTSFGRPLFRSEQFALEGPDAVSAYVGGSTAVDEGVTVRAEIGLRPNAVKGLTVSPYAFAAGGAGRIAAPTALEPSHLSAGAVGVGARVRLGKTGIGLMVEYAHGFSTYAPLTATDRANVALSIRF